MKTIMFKKEFYEAIKNGIKTQTIRKKTNYFKAEDICSINFNKNFLIKIKNIQIKKFNELTENEILKDGFKDKKALKDKLIEIYNIIDSLEFSIIEFELVKG